MDGDVSLLLDLDAKQLYNELQQVQNHIVALAKHSTEHGEKAGHGFVNSLKNAFSGIGDVLGNVKNAITSTAGLFGIGIGVGAGIAEIKSVIEFGAHIEDLSRKTGVNAETLSRWGFAAQKTGTDIEGLSKFIGFLEINREKAARGDNEKIAAFERLGSTAERVKDPLLSIDNILEDISKGNTNPLDLKAVGGKGSTEVIELLRGVGDGTLKIDKALSELDVKKLKEIQLAFTDLTNSITVGLAPAIVQVFRSLEDHADSFVTNIRKAVVEITGLKNAYLAGTSNYTTDFSQGYAKQVKRDPNIKDPSEYIADAHKESEKLDQDLFNRQTQREKKRIEEETESKNPKTDKHSLLSEDADEIAEGKAAKKEAKKEEKEDEKDELDVIGADTESKLDSANDERKEREQAARDAEKDEKQAEKDKDKDQKDQAKDAKDSAKEQSKRNKLDKADEDFAKNPTGVSLHDYATSPYLNQQSALARQAESEEKLARDLQLRGLKGEAAEHQNIAEHLKKSLGLPSKEDAKDNIKKGLDESETLKKIEKNTANAGANK